MAAALPLRARTAQMAPVAMRATAAAAPTAIPAMAPVDRAEEVGGDADGAGVVVTPPPPPPPVAPLRLMPEAA